MLHVRIIISSILKWQFSAGIERDIPSAKNPSKNDYGASERHLKRRSRKKKTNKPRFRLRWWLLIISVIGVGVVLSVFFPQILALVLLAALSAAVAKIIDRVLDRFFKKPPE